MRLRLRSLAAVLLCPLGIAGVSLSGSLLFAQQQEQQQPAQKPPAPANPSQTAPSPAEPPKDTKKPPEPPKKQQNPFENVPAEQQEAKPAAPPAEQEQAAKAAPQAVPDVVESIDFRGSRRVPQDTLKALIFSKPGDPYDAETLHRDFMAIWNTGRFDDISIEREAGKRGWIIRFVLTERRVVRSIKYDGNKSITVSEILDRFKERRVGLSVEQQYEQGRVQHAANVLKEFLAERGRQFATVTPEVHQIPPASVEVVFKIVEGMKVKVGNIDIVDNKVYGDRAVIRAMKNLHPIGLPHSIFFENLFAKTYDSTKLDEDMERIRQFYMSNGYFLARATDHSATIRDVGGRGFRFPIVHTNAPGKVADIKVVMDEGRLYRLNKINFIGVKLFKTPEALMRPIFGMQEGDVFSTEKLQKGFKNLQKLYGEFGYIDAVPEPDFNPMPDGKIDLTINVDEGKQFFVRRIDFTGNTTTRDKVIRRELLIDEGDMYNTRLWELSILRLNQLGYFDALKADEAATITRDTKNDTVDILLKVKERGKNSITLNGGVSGISGSFIGLGYSTNNFLGLGETLSINSELGDRIRSATFGFTEPYFLDRPIQAGFTVYTQRFNYNQAVEVSLLSGRNLIPLYQAAGLSDSLLNYVSNGYGATVFASYPLKRSFSRVSLTYGIDRQNITTLNTVSANYFQYSNFLNQFNGPNSLNGIVTSKITPAFTYNTIDHPITPTHGKSFYASMGISGGILGGNVNMLDPTVSFTYFHPGWKKGHVYGFRLLGRMLAGYGGKAVPPYSRIFMGGENDVRGFEIWSIIPLAYVPSDQQVAVLNDDGSQRVQKTINSDGSVSYNPVYKNVPVNQLTWTGGDTEGLANFEYRIPIFGPLVLAAFFDAGVNRVSLKNQLKLSDFRTNELNNNYPYAGFTNNIQVLGGTEQIRTSTGLELQIMMPMVNAPFRVYYAYNPTVVRRTFNPAVVADPSQFPNQATYLNFLANYAQPSPYDERRTMFRFTISRTF